MPPVPLADRAMAPDVARGAMLLLIALANVHLFLWGRPLGVRLYPGDLDGAERVAAAVTLTLVDGRAYPMFGALFGYGIGQLAARGAGVGTVRRRGWALAAIGTAHAVLLYSGDIVSAYGVLAVVLAGVLVAGTAVTLATTAAVGLVVGTGLGALNGFPAAGTAALPSMAADDALTALVDRVDEWGAGVLPDSVFAVLGVVALGAWAARHRLLDEPARHRRLLATAAVTGLGAAVVGGLPLALLAADVWAPDPPVVVVLGLAHTLGGYAGGLGYAALFGLLAARTDRPGPVLRALAATGRRSLSGYLAQSVVFVLLLPAWTLGLGGRLDVVHAELLAGVVWLGLVLLAVVTAQRRGPAEALLRRLTYGRATGSCPPAPR